jgi:hypothetical protein
MLERVDEESSRAPTCSCALPPGPPVEAQAASNAMDITSPAAQPAPDDHLEITHLRLSGAPSTRLGPSLRCGLLGLLLDESTKVRRQGKHVPVRPV